MKPVKLILLYALLLSCTLFDGSCSGAESADYQVVFVGSTPGDELIRSLLTITSDSKVDFIRWNLILTKSNSKQHSFSLDLVFGEGQQNTLGFKGGGEKLSFEGEYTTSHNNDGKVNGEIYHLKSDKLPAGIKLLGLNENLLHLLTPQNQLMIGNGGWSYTLNRLKPIAASSSGFISHTTASLPAGFSPDTVGVYHGRTPCNTALLELNGISAPGCQRIKWELTLYKDPKTHGPTTFELKAVYVGTGNNVYTKTGNWEVIQSGKTNSNTFVYLLRPNGGKPEVTLTLLKGDDNILFFLDKEWNLLVGNSDHSYTLNRSISQR